MIRIKNYISNILESGIDKGKPLLLITIFLPTLANAQAFFQETSENEVMMLIVMGMVFIVFIIVLGVAFYTLTILRLIISNEKEEKAESEGIEIDTEPTAWQKLAGTAVPIEKEGSLLLDHDYDGIRELDNHLPPWWKYLFYLTIVFAVVYVFIYHVSDSLPLQDEEYKMELAVAKKQSEERTSEEGGAIDETNVEFSDDESVITSGGKIYGRACAVCHAPDGGGGVGPNLTDGYWLHGGSISDIFKTIKYGVPDKGMISWQSQLSATDMRDVSSFIMTMKGTTPASAKEPQGELYKE